MRVGYSGTPAGPAGRFFGAAATALHPAALLVTVPALDRASARAVTRRGGRVVEGARLESAYTAMSRIVGSNPTPSASHKSLL